MTPEDRGLGFGEVVPGGGLGGGKQSGCVARGRGLERLRC